MKHIPTRQKVRRMLLLVSLLAFPATIYFFSPYLIIMGASQGVVTGSAFVFGAMALASLLGAGRLWCGWLCPAGAVQDMVHDAVGKPFRGGWRRWGKYVLWVPWVLTIVLMLLRSAGITGDPLYQTRGGLSSVDGPSYFIYFAVLALFLILALTMGRRAGCSVLCWMAPTMVISRKLAQILHLPGLRLRAESGCISCKACNRACPMSLDVERMVQGQQMEHPDCALCASCADSCPKKVIGFRYGMPDRNRQKK